MNYADVTPLQQKVRGILPQMAFWIAGIWGRAFSPFDSLKLLGIWSLVSFARCNSFWKAGGLEFIVHLFQCLSAADSWVKEYERRIQKSWDWYWRWFLMRWFKHMTLGGDDVVIWFWLSLVWWIFVFQVPSLLRQESQEQEITILVTLEIFHLLYK